MSNNTADALARAQQLIANLVGEKGCQWDKEQTPESLCDYIIEECNELVEAIRSKKTAEIQGEMGDVFFLLLFLAHRYTEQGAFTLADVFSINTAKMIKRHPHVFGDANYASKDEQLAAWEAIKRTENTDDSDNTPKGIFHSLPKGLPALVKAYRLHSKAAKYGFTWDSDDDVEQQVEAEWLELFDAIQEQKTEQIEQELGDLLFTLVELGRRKGIKANGALEFANAKFLRRFEAMEALAVQEKQTFTELSFEEMDALWNRVKETEK